MSKRVIDAVEVARAHESLGLTTEIADQGVYERTVQRFQERNIALPTFAELADPSTIPAGRIALLAGLDRNEPDSRNLFRCTGSVGSMAAVPTRCPNTSNSRRR